MATNQEAFKAAGKDHCRVFDQVCVGVTHSCETCNPDDVDEDEFANGSGLWDEACFGTRPCATCGSSLAGGRHHGHAEMTVGFPDAPRKEWVHIEMCTDCVLYFANDDLPESWESSQK